MGHNIKIENNTGTINIYDSGAPKSNQERETVHIASVDKYSSPLFVDIDYSPWGKDMHRVSVLVRNALIGQVLQRTYLTYKNKEKAMEIFNSILEDMKNFKVETEEKLVHSSIVIPKIWNRMFAYEETSEINSPESDDLRKRCYSPEIHKDFQGGKPRGLTFHPVEDHFPEHNGIVKKASKDNILLKYSENNFNKNLIDKNIKNKMKAILTVDEKIDLILNRLENDDFSLEEIEEIVDDKEWIQSMKILYENNPQDLIELYKEIKEETQREAIAQFVSKMNKISQVVQENLPQETQYGLVEEGTPTINNNILAGWGADENKAVEALELIQNTSKAGMVSNMWIGLSEGAGHLGVYEDIFEGQGFRVNMNEVNSSIQKLVSEIQQDIVSFQNNMDNRLYSNYKNEIDNVFGGPDGVFNNLDINEYMAEVEQIVTVLIIAEVMVHEVTHAQGATDEGAPVENEKSFLEEAIDLINKDRLAAGKLPIALGVKNETASVIQRIIKIARMETEFLTDNDSMEQMEELENKYFELGLEQDKEDILDDFKQEGAMGISFIDDNDNLIKGYVYGYELVYDEDLEEVFEEQNSSNIICYDKSCSGEDFFEHFMQEINSGTVFYISNLVLEESKRFNLYKMLDMFLDGLRHSNYEYITFDALSDTYNLIMKNGKPNKNREALFGLQLIAQTESTHSEGFFIFKILK